MGAKETSKEALYITVRQVFEAAYGPIPEGATCHMGIYYDYNGFDFGATYNDRSSIHQVLGDAWAESDADGSLGPDMSDCPASVFRKFFDDDYDEALAKLESSEESGVMA